MSEKSIRYRIQIHINDEEEGFSVQPFIQPELPKDESGVAPTAALLAAKMALRAMEHFANLAKEQHEKGGTGDQN